jgi:hypothetical protein
MALALAPLVVTLTFGMPPGASPGTQAFTKYTSIYPRSTNTAKFSIQQPVFPAERASEPPAGAPPRWPGDLRVGIERSDWIVVFVGARFFRPHQIRAVIRDFQGATESDVSLISGDGWAGFQPKAPLVSGHTYFISLTLIDNAGRESIGHPTVGFIMPDEDNLSGTLVLAAQGDPPLPGLWEPAFVEKLLFFMVDPFVLSFMATGALLRRRRRRLLSELLA